MTYIAPYPASLKVTAQIKGCETAVADGEFFARRVQCRLEDGDAVVLQHVEELRSSLCQTIPVLEVDDGARVSFAFLLSSFLHSVDALVLRLLRIE